MIRGFGGPPWGVCCHHDLFPFRATGLRRTDRRQVMSFFCFFVLFVCDDFLPFVLYTGTLDIYLHRPDVLSQALPQTFCRFFLGSLRFVAFCFLWVGGVPLAAFCPPGFLVGSGWSGWGFPPSLAL